MQETKNKERLMTMKALVVEGHLEKTPHNELVRMLAANPSNRELVREFVLRYDTAIRSAAAREIYKRRKSSRGVLHLEIEDAVSETYVRLFRNEAKALREFRGHYPNSIFAFLRMITYRTISIYYRALHNENFQSLVETEDRDEAPCLADTSLAANHDTERQSLEAIIRRYLHQIFRPVYVNRNFIICKLHLFYGYRADEIACIKGLGLSEHSINNTSHRVRQLLKRKRIHGQAALGF